MRVGREIGGEGVRVGEREYVRARVGREKKREWEVRVRRDGEGEGGGERGAVRVGREVGESGEIKEVRVGSEREGE